MCVFLMLDPRQKPRPSEDISKIADCDSWIGNMGPGSQSLHSESTIIVIEMQGSGPEVSCVISTLSMWSSTIHHSQKPPI